MTEKTKKPKTAAKAAKKAAPEAKKKKAKPAEAAKPAAKIRKTAKKEPVPPAAAPVDKRPRPREDFKSPTPIVSAPPAVRPALKPKPAIPAAKPPSAPASAPKSPATAAAAKPAAPPAPAQKPAPSPSKPAPAPAERAPEPARAEIKPAAVPRGKVTITENTTVKDLAEKMNAKLPDVMKKLIGLGIMANLNQRLGQDVATLIADAFHFDIEMKSLYADEVISAVAEDASQLKPRPPVVTIMGHVDHGKTSLLDAIRSARVAEKEAGGITQHIGAYQVQMPKGSITFLDTPGHEAFTSMRARGAQATDIVVLVVGADDGVMPQTVEAIDHARAANVPIVVAINKMDLPTANPQRIKQALANLNLAPEDWGGKTVMVEVSAKQKTNLDKLLEMLLLEAELLDLKANPDRPAQAVVVEAKMDPRRGPVATVLIQKGTLRVGDSFVCGLTAGKARALVSDRGDRLKEALPSQPVEIMGLSTTPQAGDRLVVVASDKEAREIAERRQGIATAEARKSRRHVTLETLHAEAVAGKLKTLPIILKADVQGSLEALRDSLEKLPSDEIVLRIIHAGIGGISNSDVVLADASDAVILGFNVRPDPSSETLAKREGVDIKTYRIIYDMIGDVKKALEGLLEPEEKEVTTGWAEVRKTFSAPKVGVVAGCMITDGRAARTGKVRLLRNGAIVFEGAIGSLKRFKDDVRDVEKGFECGVSLANFQDVKIGDRMEFYVVEKQARKL